MTTNAMFFVEGAGPVKNRGHRHVTQFEAMIRPAPCRKRQNYKVEGLSHGMQVDWTGVYCATGSSFEPGKDWSIL